MRKLSLDQLLTEVEKDENYEYGQIKRQFEGNPTNHKQYITWREFSSYLTDYKSQTKRNKTKIDMVQQDDTQAEAMPSAEEKTLLEVETERRLA